MARKKKGLPFVVQPRLEPIIERVGSEESGIIEIERKGYLTVAEKTIVDQATSDMSDQGELLAAVKQIAKAEGKTVSEVFDLLQGDEAASLLETHAEQIAAASSSARSQQNKLEIIAATALIMCRIDAAWGVDQSMELHPDLLDGLFKLYQDEDARSLDAFSDVAHSDDVKK